jgi:small-conductance mechanosensitive channel
MLEKLEKSMRKFFEKSLVSEEYLPRLFLVDVQGTRVKVNLRLWIKEVQQSDEIGSSVREAVRARFLAEGIQFADP